MKVKDSLVQLISGRNKNHARWLQSILQIARFGIVGVGATLIHGGVAWLLLRESLLPLLIINCAAFGAGFIFSFLGHYHWTFRGGAPKLRSLMRFFTVAFGGLLVSTLVLSIFIHVHAMNDIAKLAISILVIPPVTFILGKLWAFAPG